MHVDAILEILHLIAAVVFVSPMLVYPFVGVAALRAGNAAGAASAARSTRLMGLLALSVVVFGSLAVAGADPDRLTFVTPWLLVSLIAYLLSVAIAVGVVAPALFAGGHAPDRAGPRAIALAGAIAVGVLTLVVTVLMVWRPTG
jgi:uncharacterized membrane protein